MKDESNFAGLIQNLVNDIKGYKDEIHRLQHQHKWVRKEKIVDTKDNIKLLYECSECGMPYIERVSIKGY